MASGAAIRAKIKATLQKLQPTSRLVQFRQVEIVGGNERLGIGGVQTVTLTPVDPQPAVESLMLPAVARSEDIASANALLQPGDYMFTFDGSISETLLRESQILYGDEILSIVRVDPAAIDKTVVAWSVLARTIQTRS